MKNTKMKKKILFCSMLILLIPGTCFATSGDDPANKAAASLVTGVYDDVVGEADSFVDQKEDAAEAYLASQKQLIGQVESIKKAQISAVVAAIKQHAITLITQKNSMNYSEASKSLTACEDQKKALVVLEGASSRKDTEKDSYDSIMTRNSNAESSNEIRHQLDAFLDESSLSAGSTLMGDDGNTMSNEQIAEAAKVAFIITNQSPDYKMTSPEHYLRRAGEKYNSFRKMKIAKISLSQKIMANYLARKSAVYPLGEWASVIKEHTADISESNVVDGKVSADTILDLEVRQRYMNPMFEKNLHTKNEKGVLEEILAMQTVDLEFQRLELEHQEYMTALTAYQSGSLAQGMNEALNKRMKNQIKQSN